MRQERRSEPRLDPQSLWASVGDTTQHFTIDNIAATNLMVRGEVSTLHMHEGDTCRMVVHVPIRGQLVRVPLRATVVRVDEDALAVSYDKPCVTWRKVLEMMARPQYAV